MRCLEIAEQSQLLFTGLISGTALAFPLNSRQDVACIPPPEPQKPDNHMAMSRQQKQFATADDDLVLADPCPVTHRPTQTIRTQIPDLLGDYRVTHSAASRDSVLQDCPGAQGFPLEGHRSRSPAWQAATGSSRQAVDPMIPCSVSGTWSSVSSNLSRAILRHHSTGCQWLITAPGCQGGCS